MIGLGTALALGVVGASGCGASRPTSAEAAAAETAETVCTMLRDWDNSLSDAMNATSASITDDDDPATANQVLLDGFDEVIAIAESHVDEVDDLDLPAIAERQRLVDELRAGAEEAVAGLEADRAEAADLPPIGVSQQAGAVGGAMLAMEHAMSSVEPAIGTYDDERLRAAFADNPGCQHVIQPF
jgi:hypothetical protein